MPGIDVKGFKWEVLKTPRGGPNTPRGGAPNVSGFSFLFGLDVDDLSRLKTETHQLTVHFLPQLVSFLVCKERSFGQRPPCQLPTTSFVQTSSNCSSRSLFFHRVRALPSRMETLLLPDQLVRDGDEQM